MRKIKNNLFWIAPIFVIVSFIFFQKLTWADSLLAERLKGRLLLQVKNHGAAWYISPRDLKAYELGGPDRAFDFLKTQSLAVKTVDLKKIPFGFLPCAGNDQDADGLSDDLESAIGTRPEKADSDGDGFNDKTELMNNYSPDGKKKIAINFNYAKSLAGNFLIQFEDKGQLWYVNPTDLKKYYIGQPADLLILIKKQALGISNPDLSKIGQVNINDQVGQNSPNLPAANSPPLYIPGDSSASSSIIVNLRPDDAATNQTDDLSYSDPGGKFFFHYPTGWKIKKFENTTNSFQLTDANVDFIKEKKGAIIISYFKSEDNIDDMSAFKIATKGDSKTLTDNGKKIGTNDAYENSYRHEHAYEKTTTVKISSNEFLQLSLVTAAQSESYLNTYDNLLNNLKFK